MIPVPSGAALPLLNTLIEENLGLSFPVERWRDLERALGPVAEQMGFKALESYARWLVTTPLTQAHLDVLAARLTVGETYFFREPQAFDALREHIIPQLLATHRGKRRRLRIWSAGCCTGEEAYSLAVFFDRHFPELRDWQLEILGTDINPRFLEKARAAVYRSWSFRKTPEWLQRDYFSPVSGGGFALRDDIRRKVSFEQFNLADMSSSLLPQLQGADLIFCRNVFMYFSPHRVSRIVADFHSLLAEGGHLVVSVCESSPNLAPAFRSRSFAGVTFYQKTTRLGPAIVPVSVPLDLCPAFEDVRVCSSAADPGPERPAPRLATELYIARARELLREGNYTEATAELESALAQAPLNADAASLLAQVLANQGRLAEARRWIERAIATDKLSAPSHHLRATVLQELGEFDLAVDALEKALYLDPHWVLPHLTLAQLARQSGRAEKSARHLAQALRLLRRYPSSEVIAEAGDLSAGRLIAMVEAMLAGEVSS